MFAAFECAVLAEMSEDENRQSSYLNLAMEAGYSFFASLEAGAPDLDIPQGIPAGVLWNMSGPNPDFAMGRIYEAAAENVLDDLGFFPDDDAGRTLVNVEISKRNCDLLTGLQ